MAIARPRVAALVEDWPALKPAGRITTRNTNDHVSAYHD